MIHPSSQCFQCGYPLEGLETEQPCPECGSSRRRSAEDLAKSVIHAKWCLALNACGHTVFCIALPLAALGYTNGAEFYGVFTWPLILGWLAGSAFLIAATFSGGKAISLHSNAQKAVDCLSVLIWIGAVTSALLLFKNVGESGSFVLGKSNTTTLACAMWLTPLIIIASAGPSILLVYYCGQIQRKKLRNLLFASTAFQTASLVCLIGLFAIIWLDWEVGLDLHLRFYNATAQTISLWLQWSLVICWFASLFEIATSMWGFKIKSHSWSS